MRRFLDRLLRLVVDCLVELKNSEGEASLAFIWTKDLVLLVFLVCTIDYTRVQLSSVLPNEKILDRLLRLVVDCLFE
jgi:hypothetical protein